MLTHILYTFMIVVNNFILWYVVAMSSINIIQVLIAIVTTPIYIRKARHQELRLMSISKNMIPMSLLVPAHNEEVTIVESIKSLLNMNYINFEVIVINDGSTDKTLDAVIGAFNLNKIIYPVREQLPTQKVLDIYYNPDLPRLYVIDKENGGKSDALNAGINLSHYPYIVSIDADSLLNPDALLRIAMAFIQDKYAIAVGGLLRVSNGCTIENGKVIKTGLPHKFWPLLQIIEYFRSFLVGRIGWSILKSLPIISGAFGAFKKDVVLRVDGYTTGTLGEDMDLVIKLHRYMRLKKYKYQVSFMPDPVCWTQVPDTLNILFRQRRRWQIGLMNVLFRNKDMILNPRFGVLGMIAMPHQWMFETMAPVVEILGYFTIPLAYYFNILSLQSMILFFLASFAFGVIVSIGSLLVEDFTNSNYISVKEFIILSLLSIAENLFYRQMTVFFRLRGIMSYHKFKHSWGVMTRQKFSGAEKTTENNTEKNNLDK